MKVESKDSPAVRVRCIDITNAESDLILNGIYTVTGESAGDYYLKETPWSYMKSRFEVVAEEVDHLAEALKSRDELLKSKSTLGPQVYVPDAEEEKLARNKYMREIKKGVWVDCYDVLRAWEVTDPCLQHLLKKALAGGQRGHKDLHEDLQDILASAKRAVEMHEEWNK